MLDVSELQDTSIKEAEEAEINGTEEIQLRKPNKGFEFFRTHPEIVIANLRVLENPEEKGKYFIINPTYRNDRVNAASRGMTFFPAVNSDEQLFLWGVGSAKNEWNDTAKRIAVSSRGAWMSLSTVRTSDSSGHYVGTEAMGDLGDPVFPDLDINGWLSACFTEDDVIENDSHPIVKKLLGIRD